MAAGRVITGFSKVYAAIYNSSEGGAVTYSGAQRLARGVEVSVEAESSDDNIFYADNVAAENASGTFTGGTLTLTTDEMFNVSKRKFFGLPSPDADGWTAEGESANAPYVGVGWITRYTSDGINYYVPTVVAKAKFKTPGESAKTQESEIDYQTRELQAALMRDDTPNHNWRFIGSEYSTEDAAEAALVQKLGGAVAVSFVVSFNSNGGSAVASQTVVQGETATKPTDPTYGGYTFAGWYADSDFQTEYTFTEPVMKNTTLFAKWS